MTDENPHLQPGSPPLAQPLVPQAQRQVPPIEPPKPSPPKFSAAPMPATARTEGPSADPLPFRPPRMMMYPGESAASPRIAPSETYPLNSNAPCGIEEAKALGIPIGPPIDYHDPRYHPTETDTGESDASTDPAQR